jgi:hypothetical protein
MISWPACSRSRTRLDHPVIYKTMCARIIICKHTHTHTLRVVGFYKQRRSCLQLVSGSSVCVMVCPAPTSAFFLFPPESKDATLIGRFSIYIAGCIKHRAVSDQGLLLVLIDFWCCPFTSGKSALVFDTVLLWIVVSLCANPRGDLCLAVRTRAHSKRDFRTYCIYSFVIWTA